MKRVYIIGGVIAVAAVVGAACLHIKSSGLALLDHNIGVLSHEDGYMVDAGIPIAVETELTRRIVASAGASQRLQTTLKTSTNYVQIGWIAFCLRILNDQTAPKVVSTKVEFINATAAGIETRFALHEFGAYLSGANPGNS